MGTAAAGATSDDATEVREAGVDAVGIGSAEGNPAALVATASGRLKLIAAAFGPALARPSLTEMLYVGALLLASCTKRTCPPATCPCVKLSTPSEGALASSN